MVQFGRVVLVFLLPFVGKPQLASGALESPIHYLSYRGFTISFLQVVAVPETSVPGGVRVRERGSGSGRHGCRLQTYSQAG